MLTKPNIVGDSKLELPFTLEKVSKEQIGSLFILIDGDHTRSGVRADLNNTLKLVPRYPTIIVAHDSFNPGCRTGSS